MKKKIIYISGADVFEISDVRAAFEEVRNTLKLDADTILFGVPVDESDAICDSDTASADCVQNAPVAVVDDETDTAVLDDAYHEDDALIVDEDAPVLDEAPSDECVDDSDAEIDVPEADAPDMTDDTEITDTTDDSDTPVVPILSVLASKSTTEIIDAKENDTDDDEPIQETVELNDNGDDILDGISDDMPIAAEKTLEELLETMTPLREDAIEQPKRTKKHRANDVEIAPVDEIDATLENLASEFAENQDRVPSGKKGSERGKIGKLKNILPFKKVKRDDAGLMGDLFGWAGIAANDEDFTIPGFFTNAASKK